MHRITPSLINKSNRQKTDASIRHVRMQRRGCTQQTTQATRGGTFEVRGLRHWNGAEPYQQRRTRSRRGGVGVAGRSVAPEMRGSATAMPPPPATQGAKPGVGRRRRRAGAGRGCSLLSSPPFPLQWPPIYRPRRPHRSMGGEIREKMSVRARAWPPISLSVTWTR